MTLALADVDDEKISFLWGTRIPVGWISMLYGDGGCGKSTLAIGLAVASAAGVAFLGIDTSPAASVLLLDGELTAGVVAQMARKVAKGLGTDLPANVIYHRLTSSIVGAQGRREVSEIVNEVQPDLVVVDSFEAAAPDLDAMNLAAVGEVMGFFASLVRTVLIVDHVAKPNAQAPMPRTPYGAAVKLHRARAGYLLRRVAEGYILSTEKSNFTQPIPPLAFDVEHDGEAIRFRCVELATRQRSNSTARVAEVVESLPGPATVEQIADRAGLAKGTVRNSLSELKRAERVTNARGLWSSARGGVQ